MGVKVKNIIPWFKTTRRNAMKRHETEERCCARCGGFIPLEKIKRHPNIRFCCPQCRVKYWEQHK